MSVFTGGSVGRPGDGPVGNTLETLGQLSQVVSSNLGEVGFLRHAPGVEIDFFVGRRNLTREVGEEKENGRTLLMISNSKLES